MRTAFVLATLSMLVVSGCLGATPASKGSMDDSGVPTLVLVSADGSDDLPAALDGLDVTMTDTPEHLVVEVGVAQLTERALAALVEEGYRWVYWQACWNPGEYGGRECAGLQMSAANGVADLQGTYEMYLPPTAGCNDWWWCGWQVPYELTFGEPGAVRVTVPRDVMSNGTMGAVLEQPVLSVWASQFDTTASDALGDRWAVVGACAVAACVRQQAPEVLGVSVDDSAAGQDYVLRTEDATLEVPSGTGLLLEDPAGDVGGAEGQRPDLDILSVVLEEDESSIAVRVEVADLGSTPPSHWFDMSLGVGGTVHYFGYEAVAGMADGWAGHCSDADCSEYVEHGADVEFTLGAPGTVRITLDRADMGSPERGALVNLADVYLYEYFQYQSVPTPVGGPFVVVSGNGDWAGFYPHPIRLAMDTA